MGAKVRRKRRINSKKIQTLVWIPKVWIYKKAT